MDRLRRYSYGENGASNRNGKIPEGDPTKGLLWSLQKLEATHRAWDLAEQVVTSNIGVPICMAKCGKCCDMTSVQAWEIEAYFLASWLLGQDTKDKILSDCEGWLLEKDSRRYPTMGSLGQTPLTREQMAQLLPELNALKNEVPCPFLTEDKRCGIHDARPLVCRAYGVTRMPGRICPRPLGAIESEDVKAHISVNSELGHKLRVMVTESIKASEAMNWNVISFLPTAVMRLMRPEKFQGYVYDGKVATAKLLQFWCTSDDHPVVLFQDQLNTEWAKVYTTQGESDVGK